MTFKAQSQSQSQSRPHSHSHSHKAQDFKKAKSLKRKREQDVLQKLRDDVDQFVCDSPLSGHNYRIALTPTLHGLL